jgi:hypothetical protein
MIFNYAILNKNSYNYLFLNYFWTKAYFRVIMNKLKVCFKSKYFVTKQISINFKQKKIIT